MLPRNSNDNSGAAIGLIFGVVTFAGLMFMFFLCFVAFIFTTICLFAWNEPRKIGPIIILPHEARSFVERGIYGAALVPAFLCLSNYIFHIGINFDAYAAHIVVGGYVLGSVGVEILIADLQQKMGPADFDPAPTSTHTPAEPRILPPVKAPSAPRQAEPFRFASWDDEEEGR